MIHASKIFPIQKETSTLAVTPHPQLSPGATTNVFNLHEFAYSGHFAYMESCNVCVRLLPFSMNGVFHVNPCCTLYGSFISF